MRNDFKKAYDSVRREGLYKILIECGIPRKLVRLIKVGLTETYSRVRVDCIRLAQDRDRWRTLVSTVMSLRVP